MKKQTIVNFYVTKIESLTGKESSYVIRHNKPKYPNFPHISSLHEQENFRILQENLENMDLTLDELYEYKVLYNQEYKQTGKIRRIKEKTFNMKFSEFEVPLNEVEIRHFAKIFACYSHQHRLT